MQDVPGEVIERCRNGDIAALGEIYALLGGRVWRVARNLLACEADADDLTQEVFLRLFRCIGQFEGRSSLGTWIHRTTVNLCLTQLARDKGAAQRRRELESLPEPAAEISSTAPAESEDELAAWLGPLDPDARAILVLREVEGLEYAQIAAALGVPLGTVMSRLSRARAKLAQVAKRRDPAHGARTGAIKS